MSTATAAREAPSILDHELIISVIMEPEELWQRIPARIAQGGSPTPKDILRKVVRNNVMKPYDLKIDGINA